MRKAAVTKAFAVLGALGISAAQAQTTVAGLTPGTFRVTESGAAEYRIPIKVPPGIAGMEPKLALVYSSQTGNGLLGMGGGLDGLSTITRCPQTLAQDGTKGGVSYDWNDRYCLDGQRLVMISGTTYGASEAQYRTERESFTKVVSYGVAGNGPAWFKVWTKSGQILEYGNTADSRIEAQGKATVRTWALNKASDTKGNYLAISYVEDSANGDYRPERMDYTGNTAAGLAPANSVRFIYEARPDVVPLYVGGSVLKMQNRLTNIKTYAGLAPVKDYRLAYQSSVATQRSLVTSVTECAGDGTCLPANTLAWQGQALGSWTLANSYAPPAQITNAGRSGGVELIDLNGDGLVDIVWQAAWDGWTPQAAWLNTGSGWQEAPQYIPPAAITNQGRDAGVRFVDLNGDGLVDMVWNAWWEGPWAPQGAWLNNGNGWTAVPSYIPPAQITNQGRDGGVRFIDLNGDGLVDMVWQAAWDGWTPQAAWLNTGSGWQEAPQYVPPAAITNQGRDAGVRFVDLNGDGLVDMVWNAWWEGPWAPQGAWLNNGNGWTAAPSYVPPAQITNQGRDGGVRFIDLNGDGLVDMVWQAAWDGWTPQAAWLNTGSGWQEAPQYIPPAAITNQGRDAGVRFVDLNGDGLVDMVWNAWWEGPWAPQGAWLNNGNGWTAAPSFIPPAQITNQGRDGGVRFIDLNGDGMVDIAWHAWWEGWNPINAWTNFAIAPDLLASVNSSLGVATSITYKPLTDTTAYSKDTGAAYPVLDLQGPLYVVSSASSSDGIGGARTLTYFYTGAKAHQRGGGSLGFRKFETTDALGARSAITFRQDYPFQGLPVSVVKTQPSGAVLSQVTNTWTDSLFNNNTGKYNRTDLTSTVESGFDLNGASLPTVTTNTAYDAYGNVSGITVSTGDGYSKTTTNIYSNDVPNWLLGRLTRSTVSSTSP